MKANFVVSGISSVVGMHALSAAMGIGMAAAGVTSVSTLAAATLTFGIPIVGSVIGIALADNFFGKGEEKRSWTNSLATAAMAYAGYAVVGTALGVGGLVAGAVAGSFALTMAGATAGSLLGSGLGAVMGAGIADWLTAKKIPHKAAADPAAGAALAPA